LPGKEPGKYILEEYRLALVPVPQLLPVLVNNPNRKQLAKQLLVVGGVIYDRRAQSEAPSPPPEALAATGPWRPWQRADLTPEGKWPFLDGTESEVMFIKTRYQEVTKAPADHVAELRGEEATKAQFCLLAPQCSILHIATHGFFLTPEEPSARAATSQPRSTNMFGDRLEEVRAQSPGLLSGLVLAGANDPPKMPKDLAELKSMPDDGYLTADEIAFLPLGGAQLVVLSACETGLGEVAGGEGLLGIQRAFQVAGARTTIATLWKVDDEVTRRIMEQFYKNYLEKGLSPSDALREAQLWALKTPDLIRGADAPTSQTDSTRLPPKFWAAFTLSGDWR
jgi:CHAT domain-containing protein